MILDHCSAGWSVDESLSLSSDVADVTVQWCLIAEALNRSVHRKGPHGYGSLVRATGGVTLHHNLWAHNAARNPRLGDDYGRPPWPLFDVRNNVIYDYGGIASGMTGDNLRANYVGNYVRPGPSSDTRRGVIVLTDTAAVSYHVAGNVVEGRPGLTADNRLFDRVEAGGRRLVTLFEDPFETPPVRTTAALQALRRSWPGPGPRGPAATPSTPGSCARSSSARAGSSTRSGRSVAGRPTPPGPAPARRGRRRRAGRLGARARARPVDPADGPRSAATATRTWRST